MLIEKFIYINSNKETISLSNYYQAFSFALIHPVFNIRKNAQDTLKRLIKKISSSNLILSFLNSLTLILDSYFDGVYKSSIESLGSSSEQLASMISRWPFDKGFVESLLLLTSAKNLTQKEIEELSFKCLMLANNPMAKRIDPNLYEKCLNKLIENILSTSINSLTSSDQLIDKQLNTIFEISTKGNTLTQVS